jgi:hypothetical protein
MATMRAVVEVVDGPMEGLCAAAAAVRIGRGEGADLPLAADPWVSRRHVRIALEGNALVAEDEGGRNGTWQRGGRITGTVPLAAGEFLLVGRTPVQASVSPAEDRSDPALAEIPPALDLLLARATKAAAKDARAIVDAFDLARVLLASGDAEVQALLAASGASPATIAQATATRWPGSLSWIAEMTAAAWEAPPAGTTPAPTAKVRRVLAQAIQNARRAGLPDPTDADALVALAAEPRGPAARAFADLGISADALASRLAALRGSAIAPTPPSPPTFQQPATPTPAAPPPVPDPHIAAPSLFEFESWDVFREAKEIADRIRAVQATYHLADPDARRSAIEEVLAGSFAEVVPERRDRVLRHLADLFPLPEGAPALPEADPEAERLREDVTRLRARLAASDRSAPPPPPAAAVEDIVRMVVDPQADLAGVPEDQRPALRMLRGIYRFARDVERLTASVVQSFHSRAADMTRFVIPPFRKDLKDLVEGKAQAVDDAAARQVETYLAAVRQWLVAAIVGYSQAASEFCREFAGKIDPRAIERQAQLPKWLEAMGLSDASLWKRFKEVFTELQVDLVDDQVLESAARLAAREVEKLKRESERRDGA